jgi:hypothetical protein
MVDVSVTSSAIVPELEPDLVALFFDSINAAKAGGILLPKPEDFEARLTEFMKLWGSSPRHGVCIDAATEAKMRNVARFLGDALFGDQPCPDPKTRLTQGEMVFLQLLVGTSCMAGGIILKIGDLPPSSGYEQFLKQKGFDSISARGLAHLIRRSGERQAKEQQLRSSVVKAIRGLTNCRSRVALLDHARFLVQIADESSIVDTICCEVGLSVRLIMISFDFKLLRVAE